MEILEKHHIPAIINTASGGLIKPATYNPDLFHFVSQIPYSWIFPKVYGVIHHGGSGTTHLGLKYGCATMIIPHIIDQFSWNRIIFEQSAGPRGINIRKITSKNFEPKVLDLINNPKYKEKATQIKEQMKKEDFREVLYQAILGKQV